MTSSARRAAWTKAGWVARKKAAAHKARAASYRNRQNKANQTKRFLAEPSLENAEGKVLHEGFECRPCSVCGTVFDAYVGMLYCPSCARYKLELEERVRAFPRGPRKKPKTPPRSDETNDYRILDENGREWWARELAWMYRQELKDRQHRRFKQRDKRR